MPTATATPTINVNRKKLLDALTRIGWAIPARTIKPILGGVRLEATDDTLRLTATDLDTTLTMHLRVDGDLPVCVVPCADLARRLKTGKADSCAIQLDSEHGPLVINGGRVEHRVPTMDTRDFPPVATCPRGSEWCAAGPEFKNALAVALRGAALENTRYAINGILLECGKEDARLVATDGRRLVVVELDQQEGPFEGQVILPCRAATLVGRLIGRNDIDYVKLFVQANVNDKGEKEPTDLCVAGPNWMLSFKEVEGHFPLYRDVIPRSHSRFAVDRVEFIGVLDAVAMSTDQESKGVRLDLAAESVRVSACSVGGGESTGTVAVEFLGGGDARIVCGFNPEFLLDAFKSLSDDRVVIDVEQNHRSTLDRKVSGRPALICGADSPRIRWLLMPINLDLPANRETLGSNFEPDKKGDSSEPEEPSDTVKASKQAVSDQKTPSRRRRRVEHAWPEIGTRLDGEFMGETYAALVVAAPKLKAGRALQVINGPAFGRTFNSMTAAMLAATAKQRQKLGQGNTKKGLPKSGWGFWHQAEPQRMSA